eukprot:2499687-Ditylum_brightwellii.AAC.1
MNNWLTIVPLTANNSVLNKEESRDQVLMRYIITPNSLPTCKIGGLIGGQHDRARYNLGCVATQEISPHAVHNDPRVQPCWDNKLGKNAKVAGKNKALEVADVQVLQKKTKKKGATCMVIS